MPRAQTLELVNLMRGVIDEGTGAAIRSRYGITADVAGKTGTTQENTDGWFIMHISEMLLSARLHAAYGLKPTRLILKSVPRPAVAFSGVALPGT